MAMDEPGPVLLEADERGVATLTLNRPAKRNAFDEELIDELADTFRTLRGDDDIRVVFLRGAGETFCAGADIEWMRRQGARDREDNEQDALAMAHMFKGLFDLPQLTVALVHGAAMGGGVGLVSACDVAVAVTGTKFRFSEVRLGLTPATISPFVVNAIGPRWATALFMTAESFDAEFAERIGLIQYEVADATEMEAMAEHLAALALQAAPGAVADAKKLVRLVVDNAARPRITDAGNHLIDEHLLKETAKRIAARRASDEGREGLAAFLEKRKPEWDK